MNNTDGCMYELIFPSGKSYIGVTSQTPIQRFNKHVSTSKHAEKPNIVHKAIKKYGADSVIVKTLAFANMKYLYSLEIRAILAFSTKQPRGYNLTDGGEGTIGRIVSAKTLTRMSEAQKGKKIPPETRKKISAALKGRPKSKGARLNIAAGKNTKHAIMNAKLKSTGRKHTEESKAKMRIIATGRKHSLETIAKLRVISTGVKISEETRVKMKNGAFVGWEKRRANRKE